MIAVLVMDLGYEAAPVYGWSPMRHQFAWEFAEEVLGKEKVQEAVDRSLRLMREDDAGKQLEVLDDAKARVQRLLSEGGGV